jgi:hypothetical protein
VWIVHELDCITKKIYICMYVCIVYRFCSANSCSERRESSASFSAKYLNKHFHISPFTQYFFSVPLKVLLAGHLSPYFPSLALFSSQFLNICYSSHCLPFLEKRIACAKQTFLRTSNAVLTKTFRVSPNYNFLKIYINRAILRSVWRFCVV